MREQKLIGCTARAAATKVKACPELGTRKAMVERLVRLLGSFCVVVWASAKPKIAPEWGVSSGWEDFERFLSLPEVERLTSQQIVSLAQLLEDGLVEEFERQCKVFFDQNDHQFNSERLDSSISSSAGQDWDFYTLVAQMFEERPRNQSPRQVLSNLECQNITSQEIAIYGTNLIVDGKVVGCSREGKEIKLAIRTELQRDPIQLSIATSFNEVSVTRLGRKYGLLEAWKEGLLSDLGFVIDQGPQGVPVGSSTFIPRVRHGTNILELHGVFGVLLVLAQGVVQKPWTSVLRKGMDYVTDYMTRIAREMEFHPGKAVQEVGKHMVTRGIPQTFQDSAKTAAGVLVQSVKWRGQSNAADDQCSLEEQDLYFDGERIQPVHGVDPKVWNVDSGMAKIVNESTGAVVWDGAQSTLERILLVRPLIKEKVEGVTSETFDSLVHLKSASSMQDRNIYKETLMQKLEDEKHMLRLHLRQKVPLLEELFDALATNSSFTSKHEQQVEEALPGAKEKLLAMAREVEVSQDWSAIMAEAVEGALYESLVNSDDMSVDAARSPVVVDRIFGMVEQSEKHHAKMKGKKVAFLVGDTGSGKSTTASYLMRLQLTEEKGTMGQSWNHKEESGPMISSSWVSSETLYAQSFEVSNAATDFLLVDSPGFEDTRGDAYSVVTALSLDRAVEAASHISSVALVVPYAVIGEKRGQALLEVLARLQSRFPEILSSKQFEKNGVDQGLHVIITKCKECSMHQRTAAEDGVFAKDAHEHCVKKLENDKSSGKDALAIQHQKAECDQWKTLVHLAARKRIHLLDVKNKVRRKPLLDSLRSSLSSKPTYGSSFHDHKYQKSFEYLVSNVAHTWRVLLRSFLSEVPAQMAKDKETMCKKHIDMLELIKHTEEEEARLEENVQKWLKLSEGQSELANEELAGLIQAQSEAEINASESSLAYCNQRLNKTRDRRAKADAELSSTLEQMQQVEKKIDGWRSGSTDIVLLEITHQHGDPMELLVGCGKEFEQALDEVRELNQGACTGRSKEGKVADFARTVQTFEYIPKDYKLIPANPEEAKRFSTELRDEKFGTTIAKVSGKKYTLKGRKAAPDGRRVAYLFELHFDAAPPYPEVKVVHQIANIDYFEANLRNADANLTHLKARRDRADMDLKGEDLEIGQVEKECLELKQKIEEQRQNSIKQGVEEKLKVARRQLQEFQHAQQVAGQQDRFTEEQDRLEQEVESLRREQAKLALVIKKRFGSMASLEQLSAFIQRVLTSNIVQKDVFQELQLFSSAYKEAIASGARQMAEDSLEQYAKKTPVEKFPEFCVEKAS